MKFASIGSWVMIVAIILSIVMLSEALTETKQRLREEINTNRAHIESIRDGSTYEDRLNFIAFADSVIGNFHSSNLTMSERVVFARHLWNSCKEFGMLEYRYVMLALAEVESSYQKNAISHKGARGICQFLPSTFVFVSNTLNEYRSRDEIFSLELQARYATFYLKMLLEDTEYDLELALSRYNAGHTMEINNYARKVLATSDNLLSNLTPSFSD